MAPCRIARGAWAHVALLVVVVLTVLRVLPVPVAALALVYAVLFDRRALRIDYALVGSFLCFFGFATLAATFISSPITEPGRVFAVSALASQVISNVPAALLFARFTDHWPALLWGVSVGGFGSLVGSLANLIGYRLYVAHPGSDARVSFTIRFLAAGFAAFLFGIGLYYGLDTLGWLPRHE